MTVNHGVLGSSPCSGAIARGLRERCRRCVDSTSIERTNISLSQAIFGSLAQLVQSICLTSRGSAVRIRQLPLNRSTSLFRETCFFCFLFICLCEHADCTKTKKNRQALSACLLFFRELVEFELRWAVSSSAVRAPSELDCAASSLMTR